MKSICSFEPHLVIHEMTLFRGGEWQPNPSDWLVIGVSRGPAYWMHPRLNQELVAGSVLVLSRSSKGIIRSSQLEETRLVFFRVHPDLMTGVATLTEERFLRQAASLPQHAMRILAANDAIAEAFWKLCEHRSDNSLAFRLQLLELFVQSLGPQVKPNSGEQAPPSSARTRLEDLLKQIPTSEMMKMDFGDLAKELSCTPRHLSRTFREVVGISFRQKQAEARLIRARELLATTRTKVLDVALESGYQSPSLFNVMFKRQFGLTPAKWREQAGKRKPRIGLAERGLVRRSEAAAA